MAGKKGPTERNSPAKIIQGKKSQKAKRRRSEILTKNAIGKSPKRGKTQPRTSKKTEKNSRIQKKLKGN